MRRRSSKIKAERKLSLFDKIVFGINMLAVLLLLLSYLAPVTDPRDWWIIAILGLGYHLLLIANVLFVCYWTVRLRWFAWISAIAILLGFPMIAASYGFNGDTSKLGKSPGSIRMMAYNVHKFEGIDRFENEPIHREIEQIISEQNPDIISFEEFGLKKQDKSGVIDSLKRIMGTTHYFVKAFQSSKTDSIGNAIFSKYPIIESGTVPSTEFLKTRAIFADIKYGDKIIRVYSVHLAAVNIELKEKSRLIKGDVDLGNSDFIVNKLKVAFIMRSYDVSRIKRHMDDCPHPYIVAGDFNDTPNSFAVNELADGLNNAFVEKGSGFVTTYYSTFPKLQIDYILASPQFDVVSYRALNKKVSDHKPVISDITLSNSR